MDCYTNVANTCVSCGAVIPEGRTVCRKCMIKTEERWQKVGKDYICPICGNAGNPKHKYCDSCGSWVGFNE